MLNEFKLWLEQEASVQAFLQGSVVRDMVYHGTNNRFKEFQSQKSQRYVLFTAFDVQSQGHFFSETVQDAKSYGQYVMKCYINMKKPLFDPRKEPHLGVDRLPVWKEKQLVKILTPAIQKSANGGFIDCGVGRYYVKDEDEWIYNFVKPAGFVWDLLDNAGVVVAMRSLGYDGTFVEETHDYSGRSIFIMDSAQVRFVGYEE